MRIKLSPAKKNNSTQLWKDSPCCMSYVQSKIGMSYTPRFERQSIYFRDQVNKPKKIFNQFQKPDLLLHQFRRQVEQASHQKYHTASKKKKQFDDKEKEKKRSSSMSTATNLYQIPLKTEYRYDRNGFRTHHTGQYNAKQIYDKVKSSKNFFSFGRRLDLSRPLNFFPGPGSYEYPSARSSTFSKTSSQFNKRKQTVLDNPQTQRLQIKKSIQQLK